MPTGYVPAVAAPTEPAELCRCPGGPPGPGYGVVDAVVPGPDDGECGDGGTEGQPVSPAAGSRRARWSKGTDTRKDFRGTCPYRRKRGDRCGPEVRCHAFAGGCRVGDTADGCRRKRLFIPGRADALTKAVVLRTSPLCRNGAEVTRGPPPRRQKSRPPTTGRSASCLLPPGRRQFDRCRVTEPPGSALRHDPRRAARPPDRSLCVMYQQYRASEKRSTFILSPFRSAVPPRPGIRGSPCQVFQVVRCRTPRRCRPGARCGHGSGEVNS